MSDTPYPSERFDSADAEIRALREENRQLRAGRAVATARQAVSDDYEVSQVRFRTVFENSALGQKIIAPDLTIRQVNQAVVAMLGYARPADLLGRRLLDIAHPDHHADWLELQRQLWAHRRPNFTLETCLMRADGSMFWCRVTTVLFPDDGAELGYTILEDISARKAAEQALAESQALLEAIFNTSALALHLLRSVRDAAGRIIDFEVELANATSSQMGGRLVSGAGLGELAAPAGPGPVRRAGGHGRNRRAAGRGALLRGRWAESLVSVNGRAAGRRGRGDHRGHQRLQSG